VLKHDFAQLSGARLHYASAGERSAKKLIMFVHGFPEFWYAWKKILPEFGSDHFAIAPDMRGYNLSSKPAAVDQYEIGLLINDLKELAESLGYKKFTLVAHDWGGGVAWSLAIRHPEILEKLVIINCPHPTVFERELNTNPAQQKASQYTLLFQTPGAEAILTANHYSALVDIFLKKGMLNGTYDELDKQAYLEAWSQPGAITGNLNYYRASRIGPPTGPGKKAHSFETGIASPIVHVPTLVIWGEKDTALMKENLNGLEAYVPDLRIHRVPDGTHWIVHEKPDVICQQIRAFIGG
jgi:epoxide hydrolase 4